MFASVLKAVPKERRWKIILREHLVGLSVLVIFMFTGNSFLNFLGLSTSSLQITGGLILLIIAIKMIFPINQKQEELSIEEEPFIVPLAIPAVTGPTALATVLILVHQQPNQIFTLHTKRVKIFSINKNLEQLEEFIEKMFNKMRFRNTDYYSNEDEEYHKYNILKSKKEEEVDLLKESLIKKKKKKI